MTRSDANNDKARSSGLDRRQRLILTGIILFIVCFTLGDLVVDYKDGTSMFHMLAEGLAIAVGFAGVLWIWKENVRLGGETAQLGERLATAKAESESWRNKAQEYLMGLGRAIDEQFSEWHLSTSEKEVGLLLLKGLALKEIAEARGTSERTVRQQAQEVYRKSGQAGRAEFSAFFLEELLLPVAKP